MRLKKHGVHVKMNEPALETETFFCETHAQSLLCHLHQLLTSEAFCDVCLSVGSQVFKAHKNVLSAGSPYFRAMFSGGLIETSRDIIKLYDICPSVFQILLDFIYTGELGDELHF